MPDIRMLIAQLDQIPTEELAPFTLGLMYGQAMTAEQIKEIKNQLERK